MPRLTKLMIATMLLVPNVAFCVSAGTCLPEGIGYTTSTVSIARISAKTHQISHCSAVVISRQLLLTAAHCFENRDGSKPAGDELVEISVKPQVVQIGDRSLISVPISSVSVHPRYRGRTDAANSDPFTESDANSRLPTNDIAIIFVKEGMPALYKAAHVRPANDKIEAGTELVIAGYGPPTNASEANCLRAVSNTDSELPSSSNGWQMIVQPYGTSYPHVTHGDSGGPVYLVDHNSSWLVGVLSGATEEGLYAHVETLDSKVDWMKKIAKAHRIDLTAQLLN